MAITIVSEAEDSVTFLVDDSSILYEDSDSVIVSVQENIIFSESNNFVSLILVGNAYTTVELPTISISEINSLSLAGRKKITLSPTKLSFSASKNVTFLAV